MVAVFSEDNIAGFFQTGGVWGDRREADLEEALICLGIIEKTGIHTDLRALSLTQIIEPAVSKGWQRRTKLLGAVTLPDYLALAGFSGLCRSVQETRVLWIRLRPSTHLPQQFLLFLPPPPKGMALFLRKPVASPEACR